MPKLTHAQFIEKYKGRFLEYNGDQNKNQCMDLFWAYLDEVLGIDPTPYRGWGTAINCFNNFDKIKGASTKFTKVLNGPLNAPVQGDLVFWGFYPFITGFAGHVAIVDSATSMTLISFDQNWPTFSACHIQKHRYNGVKGWFHKK